MSELSQAINEMRNMRESYDQLVSQNAQLAADVRAIKDAHILSANYDGIVFAGGYEPQSAFGIIANRAEILEVHDNKDTVLPNMSAADYPLLEVFEMQAASEAWESNAMGWMVRSNTLKRIVLPNLQLGTQAYSFIDSMNTLQYLDIRHATFPAYYRVIYEVPNLIDVIFGESVTGNTNTLRFWSPANALASDSISLLTDEDIAAGFTSNLQKLLYNIREHIAANLNPNITATITFNATVYAAINADQETADAFPASWTIASHG